MVKPKTKNENTLNIFSFDYDFLIVNPNSFSFFKAMLKDKIINVSRNIAETITEEQIDIYLKDIYDNTDFKKYEKQKYYLEHYFLAKYLNIIKNEITEGMIVCNKQYNIFLNKSKSIKTSWFEKLKLMLTSDIFFDYLKDKYYYFEPDRVIAKKYYKERLKFYQVAEKILFFDKYRVFAIMQDYYYNAKRIAKYNFKLWNIHSKNSSSYSIVLKLIAANLLANLIVQAIIQFNLHSS